MIVQELQEELMMDGSRLYEKVAGLCSRFNNEHMTANTTQYPCLGLVVGATDLIALANVRRVSPESWILCPGVGAQGGEADVT
jgi:orotidine-5'-phosphate decarboxylase